MITYDENMFFTNNSYQKMWILEEYEILCLKIKKK